jgi:hypothetical protein
MLCSLRSELAGDGALRPPRVARRPLEDYFFASPMSVSALRSDTMNSCTNFV